MPPPSPIVSFFWKIENHPTLVQTRRRMGMLHSFCGSKRQIEIIIDAPSIIAQPSKVQQQDFKLVTILFTSKCSIYKDTITCGQTNLALIFAYIR
jgi:hypothetical protein